MFAYCSNSPVFCSDETGHAVSGTGITAICDGGSAKPKRVGPGLAYDQTEGTINGQGILPYANDPLGFSTYARSGCAVIAIYNAMQLLGKPQSLGSTADEFLFYCGSIGFGLGGVGPWSFDNYFRRHDVDYTRLPSYDKLTDNISEGDIIVFTAMNKKWNPFGGFHTMTAQYINGEYQVYNLYNNSVSAKAFSDLRDAFENGRWIYGYSLENGN